MAEPRERSGAHHNDEATADAFLIAELERVGATGPLWDATVRRLATVGIGTLHSIILGGRLGAATSALGRPIRLTDEEYRNLREDEVLRQELVAEAVVKGIDLFRRRAVLADQWDPSGGASIATYFVNGCLMALRNPVRDWQLRRREDQESELWEPSDLELLLEGERNSSPGPESELLEREDTAAVIDALGPVLGKAALLKISTGWTWARVAEQMGLSPKAIERRLRRFRDSHNSVHDEA